MVDLGTTNILLGIMAAVSVLEGLLIIGMGLGGFLLYRKVMELVNGLEQRQVAPAMARVNAILDDVKVVSTRVACGWQSSRCCSRGLREVAKQFFRRQHGRRIRSVRQ